MAICVNGQLLLTMLTEKVMKVTTDAQICFENTDGAAFKIKRSEKHLVDQVCKEMEELSGIALEAQECKTLIMSNVNNYINIIEDGYVKFKGQFEIDRDYHKNHSKRIVPIALSEYFINKVPVEDTIYNHLNKTEDYQFAKNYSIYDFCIGSKMTGSNKLYSRVIKGVKIIDTLLHKMNRYYVSITGAEFIKKLPPLEKNKLTSTEKHQLNIDNGQLNIFNMIEDVKIEPRDRETNIESGKKCTSFNIFTKKKDYNINYQYYIDECYKLINNLTKTF